MSTKNPTDRKCIARQYTTDRAHYVGTDATGAEHFWSMYDRTVVVVGRDVKTFALDDTPLADLGDWSEHVSAKRGWRECRISSSALLPNV